MAEITLVPAAGGHLHLPTSSYTYPRSLTPDQEQALFLGLLELDVRERSARMKAAREDPSSLHEGLTTAALDRLERLLSLENLLTPLHDRPSGALIRLLELGTTEDEDHPSTIGRYTVLGHIGQGAAGDVYRALQPDTQREVAIKLLRFDAPHFRGRFMQEISTLAALNHPRICRVFEGGIDPDSRLPYMAMELVRGAKTLTQYARLHTIPQKVILLLSACDAVADAHAHGLVHRDIKPANILVDQDGNVTIVDFGIARPIADNVTQLGAIAGTLAYASPEQLNGKVTTACDVYGLGAVLYELLSGRTPIDVANISIAEAARRIEDVAPEPPLTARRGPEADLARITLKALSKDPADRYPTVSQFSDELRQWLSGGVLTVRRESPVRTLTRFARKHSALTLSVLVTLTVSGVWAGVTLHQRNQQLAAAKEMTHAAFVALDFAYSRVGGREVRQTLVDTYIPVTQRLVAAQPRDPDAVLLLARLYEVRGDLLSEVANYAATLPFREQSLSLLKGLEKAFPDNVLFAHEAALAHVRLGDVKISLGDRLAGISHYVVAHDKLISLMELENPSERLIDDFGWSLLRLAHQHDFDGKFELALMMRSQQIALAEKLLVITSDPRRPLWSIMNAHSSQFHSMRHQQNGLDPLPSLKAALEAGRKLILLDPENRRAHGLLVTLLCEAVQLNLLADNREAAIAHLDEARALADRLRQTHGAELATIEAMQHVEGLATQIARPPQ
jgi:hypothetical protein